MRKVIMTINQGQREYEVYSERELEEAKEACREHKPVLIERSCQRCGASLYGSNLEVMRDGPFCVHC